MRVKPWSFVSGEFYDSPPLPLCSAWGPPLPLLRLFLALATSSSSFSINILLLLLIPVANRCLACLSPAEYAIREVLKKIKTVAIRRQIPCVKWQFLNFLTFFLSFAIYSYIMKWILHLVPIRPAQLAELPRSKFDPKLFPHSDKSDKMWQTLI